MNRWEEVHLLWKNGNIQLNEMKAHESYWKSDNAVNSTMFNLCINDISERVFRL